MMYTPQYTIGLPRGYAGVSQPMTLQEKLAIAARFATLSAARAAKRQPKSMAQRVRVIAELRAWLRARGY